MNQEKKIKEKLLQSAEVVKKKVKLIRDIKTTNDMALESVLKPITEPLNEMAKGNKNSTKDHFDEDYKGYFKNYYKMDGSERKNYAKRLKFSPDGNSQTVMNNSENLKRGDIYDESDSTLNDSINSEESDKSTDTSFKTSDSFSPRDNVDGQNIFDNFENIPFGVRKEHGKIMLGSHVVTINNKGLEINGRSYNLTPGLSELLFKKIPSLEIITDEDKRNYKFLLLQTNAHRRDFNPNKPIKSNKGRKYLQIIKPMFKLSKERLTSNETYTHGQGLPIMKKVCNDVSYVYWDDPNELVDRLKLLIASRDAGNTGLDNEIISIIEELHESGVLNNI
ncbi:uncharacterized protein LOC133526018 [Cydia pomonella]|uniref:uncharacterized protein LOC133526018 n=1 Tax=Cydia pomonella TaxID=82600 RepID=UPI002ADE59C2|nr:uncharacterized protein LOC133526018 [Cydia pomonella]